MFNLFVVLVGTFAVALVLVYFISAHDKGIKKNELAKMRTSEDTYSHKMDYRQFTKTCMDICEGLKLEVQDVTQSSNDEVIIHATTREQITRVHLLIVGFHLLHDETLDNQRIMEISEQIVSERLSKGIIMTTGKIDKSIASTPELAPMELVDGADLQRLARQYSLV